MFNDLKRILAQPSGSARALRRGNLRHQDMALEGPTQNGRTRGI